MSLGKANSWVRTGFSAGAPTLVLALTRFTKKVCKKSIPRDQKIKSAIGFHFLNFAVSLDRSKNEK